MARESSLPLFDETPPHARTEVVCADVLAWAQTYTGPKFHALLCDPPYHLTSVEKRFGKSSPADESFVNENQKKHGMARFAKSQSGFMGQHWDGGDIAFKPETWKALAAHLLPGAFGFAFASSRGWHRLACAIEDAGLILHPTVWLWTYGSGFPKATRIKGAEDFDGHRYGMQALKPAAEPILCFQKPYQGKPVDSITTHGAGALNIDGARIMTDGHPGVTFSYSQGQHEGWKRPWRDGRPVEYEKIPSGRWPANFCLTHTADCQPTGSTRVRTGMAVNKRRKQDGFSGDGTETVITYRCHPTCPVGKMDLQAGMPTSGGGKRGRGWSSSGSHEGWKSPAHEHYDTARPFPASSGNASRFFHTSDFALEVQEQLAQADPVRYVAKASRSERDAGLEGMPLSNGASRTGRQPDSIGLIGTPENRGQTANPYGTTAARPVRNSHPCVKPIALTRWLSTLMLPPAAYAPRRLLNVFSGSGSEAIGALLAGWDDIVLVEQDAEYVELAKSRIAYWAAQDRR